MTRGVRSVVVAVLAVSTSCAYAARPMITDDARIVDPQACQVETWVRHNRGSSERWALPACNPSGNLELTVGGAQTREGGEPQTTDVQFQGKTIFRPLESNGWGLGLAVGNLRHPDLAPARSRANDFYGYVPISASYADDAVVMHLNLGTVRPREEAHYRMTWGLGSEIRMTPRVFLIPEVFSQTAGRPLFQAGLRFWIVPGRVQIDATYGDRLGGESSRWFSLGLRLITPPFLR